MAKVTFANRGKAIDVPNGTSVLDAALAASATGVECCGIYPACGRCRMSVLEGMEHLATEPEDVARETAAALRFLPFERLACMSHVAGDVVVEMEE
jgi:ferredoxin